MITLPVYSLIFNHLLLDEDCNMQWC